MALNPLAYTEKVVQSFLRYQLTTYPFADPRLHAQMRDLLSLETARETPLLKGPFVSLSRAFRAGARIESLIDEGLLHPHMQQIIPFPSVYGHQEEGIRAICGGRTTLISTGTGSGKSECFLYPIISRCLELRDQEVPAGICAVIVYPMNALAEDQLGRLRELLAGSGIPFGMYVGKTPNDEAEVTGVRLDPGASNADYRAALRQVREQGEGVSVHPPEEICSRQVMRTRGQQPRILLTNVKQLELLLTRQSDVELFDQAGLDFLVFDEAHTFTGAQGSETACLVRRLRSYCGRDVGQTVCVATSATIVDQDHPDAARDFASRFFGVDRDQVATVREVYEEEVWAASRTVPVPPDDPIARLRDVLTAVDAPDPEVAVRDRDEVALFVPVTLQGSRDNPLPHCSGAYQLDADKLMLAPSRGVYRCRTCRRRTTRRPPQDKCLAWRCDGTLEFLPEDPDNYDLQLLDQDYTMLHPREHTAMVPNREREEIEQIFKAISGKGCTPFMMLVPGYQNVILGLFRPGRSSEHA